MAPDEAIKLLEECGAPEIVISHCRAVRDVALKIAGRFDCDRSLVETGALLHDIGRCRTNGIKHGVIGAEIAREHGLPEEVAGIIERHVGTGISMDEAEKLGLPPKEYLPRTIEEKVVSYADLLVDHDREIPYSAILEKYKSKFGEGSKQVKRLEELHEEFR